MTLHLLKTGTLCAFILLSFHKSFSQEQKDTLYYNDNWGLCEEPIAQYYRICTLNKDKSIFFKGEVKDYSLDSILLLSGNYDNEGMRDGIFKFYYSKGKIEREGLYEKNMMKGIWKYYRENGDLYAILKITDENIFIPILLLNPSGDTLISGGNGKFVLNTDDFPGIFQIINNRVEGECKDSARDGEWNYFVSLPDNRKTLTELYENGKFKKGKEKSFFDYTTRTHKPSSYLKLNEKHLATTETFSTDQAFGSTFDSLYQQKLINFLLYKSSPLNNTNSFSYKNSLLHCINQINSIITRKSLGLQKQSIIVKQTLHGEFETDYVVIAAVEQAAYTNIKDSVVTVVRLDNIRAEITFNIASDGMAKDVNVVSNLPKSSVIPLVYYLSRLTGLKPNASGANASTPVKLYLYVKSNDEVGMGKKMLVSNFIVSNKPFKNY